MRSNKRYTNVAFTKRVDYEGGAHRPPRALHNGLVCSGCGAAYLKRRWIPPSDPRAVALGPAAPTTRCPACDMEAKHLVRGFLRIEGGFANAHRPEIRRLIECEAAHGQKFARVTWRRD